MFEDLCEGLAEAQPGVREAERYGVSGQKQHGIDILVHYDDDTLKVIQCRKIDRLTPARIKSAVTDYLKGKWADESTGLILAAAPSGMRTEIREAQLTQRRRLKPLGKTFELWDQERLSKLLKIQPSLVRQFFGADVLRAFLPHVAERDQTEEITEKIEQLRIEIQGRSARPLPDTPISGEQALLSLMLSGASLQPELQEVLADLRELDPAAATQLAGYIGADMSRAARLIRHPQPWVDASGWAMHNALGQLALAAGVPEDALTAFQRAEQRAPDDRRALMFMRSRDAAEQLGDSARSEEFFEEARKLAPGLVPVRIVEIQRLDDHERWLEELDALEPTTDRQRSAIDGVRIDALMQLDRFSEALVICERILGRQPTSPLARDRRAAITLELAKHEKLAEGRFLDDVRRVADDSLAVRERLPVSTTRAREVSCSAEPPRHTR